MKGFKPTGYGPSAGFKYPSHMGFTGSTGRTTQVSAHTRVKPVIGPKHFADGGFVREDNPRMKEDSIGDQGSALIRRARSSNNLDQESGGKSPIRPGYKKGGKAKGGALAMAFAKPTRKAASMKKADGGRIIREEGFAPRRENGYTFKQSLAAIPGLIKEGAQRIKDSMYDRQRTVGGQNVSIGEAVAKADTGRDLASRYAKGGKAKKRMGYAMGGVGMAGPQRVMPMRPGMMRTPAQPPRALMRSKGGKMKRMGYADGGDVKKKDM